MAAFAAAAAALPTSAQAGTFAYTDFSDTTGLQVNGSAAAIDIAGRDLMRLTPPEAGKGGSVFNTQAIALTNDYGFSTRFTFTIGSNGDTIYGPIGADGIAFVIQTQSNSVGGLGGALAMAASLPASRSNSIPIATGLIPALTPVSPPTITSRS